MIRRSHRRSGWIILTAALFGFAAAETQADDYLKAGEVVGIGTGSLLVFGTGNYVKHRTDEKSPRWVSPPRFDEAVSRLLGGEAGVGRQNIIDSDLGSAVTTVAASLALGITDWQYPRSDRKKDFWQDQFVFHSGALTTKGLTDLFKGLVARQRPLGFCLPEVAAARPNPNRADDHHSFFSGHASSAFYAMTFLNLRIRSAMRQQLTPETYRARRWLPSTLCFTWAGYVAYSRVQAYQHYLTDVLAGALVGYLIGELFYSLSKNAPGDNNSHTTPLYLQFRIGL